MLDIIEKTLTDIAEKRAPPSTLLKMQFLNHNSFFVFERFVQAGLTAYCTEFVRDEDWQALAHFTHRLPVRWSGEANRRRLALRYILPALKRIKPMPELTLSQSEITHLSSNHGCVEFNPVIQLRPDQYGGSCATFVAFYEGFLGSEYIPAVTSGIDALNDFDQLYFKLLKDHFHLTLDDDLFVKEERKRIRTLIYELYANIVTHAMPPMKREQEPNLHDNATVRVVRISSILFPNVSHLMAHLVKYFGPYRSIREYGRLFHHARIATKVSGLRFVRINIQDNGPGIVGHFSRLKRLHPADITTDLFLRIMTTQMSSTDVAGAGFGTQNAIDAICDLNGFLSVRTDRFWATASSAQRHLTSIEPTEFNLAPMRGASFTAVFPAAMHKYS